MYNDKTMEVFPGDIYRCKSCGCEIRVLKKGKQCLLNCCGTGMEKSQELNPSLSF